MGDGETSEQAGPPELTPELAISLIFGGFRGQMSFAVLSKLCSAKLCLLLI
jgi:hypothetical protein